MKNLQVQYKIFSLIFILNMLWYIYNYTGGFVRFPPFEAFWYNKMYLIGFLIHVIGLISIIIFIASGFTKNNLLMFYLCTYIFSVTAVILSYYRLFNPNVDSIYSFNREKRHVPSMHYFYMILFLATFIYYWWILRKLIKSKTVEIKETVYETGTTKEIVIANRWQRFTNRLIDGSLILYQMIRIFFYANYLNAPDFGNEYFTLLVIETPLILFYYLLFEGAFGITAGKCLTSTITINNVGERPHFGKIILRTFCRFIPFEAFSFFKSDVIGWHDSASNTYVARCINLENDIQVEVSAAT